MSYKVIYGDHEIVYERVKAKKSGHGYVRMGLYLTVGVFVSHLMAVSFMRAVWTGALLPEDSAFTSVQSVE